MQMIFAIVAVVILITGVIVNYNERIKKSNTLGTQIAADLSPTPGPTDTPSPTLPITVSPRPTNKPVPTASFLPSPTSDTTSNSININDLIYPNSSVLSKTPAKADLTTGADPKVVTSWYKAKINSYSMNITSFVTTETNGSVDNKLIGEKGQDRISIEINRPEGKSNASINVSLD